MVINDSIAILNIYEGKLINKHSELIKFYFPYTTVQLQVVLMQPELHIIVEKLKIMFKWVEFNIQL